MAKSKPTAILLAFFGGALGLHKFYLNETGSGIFYIFLSYMLLGLFRIPITVFLGVIDAIRLAGMSSEEFEEKYNDRYAPRRYRSRHRPERRETQKSDRARYRYEQSNKRKRKNPFKISGRKKFDDYDLEEAIKDYEQALVISPKDADIHFDMAAIYSLLEKKKESFEHIEKAIASGYTKTDKILESDEFAYLRIQEEFEAFRNNGFKMPDTDQPSLNTGDLLQDDLLLSQLNKLKNLRERGLLSEKEFLYEKEKLFNK